jgi:hypothetical protein
MALRARFNAWWLAPLAVLASAVAIAVQRANVPTREDWAAATGHVRGQLRPGDGVTWTPVWAGEGRLFFEGLSVFHLPDPAAADFARYDRVWLLGAFGGGARDLPPSLANVVDRKVFGTVTVELVEPEGERVVGDLYADLEKARVVRMRKDGTEKACDFWDGRGWHCDLKKSPDATRSCLGAPVKTRLQQRRGDPHCGLDPWLHVSRDVRVIGAGARRCVWFHPIAGSTVEIRWPDAPAASKLVVDYGFADQVVSDNDLKAPRVRPARLTVRRGDAQVASHEVTVEKGWRRLEVPLEGAAAAAGPVTFAVDTSASVDAHLCFDPTLRAPRAEGGAP